MPTCKKCNTSFPNHIKINNEQHNLQSRKFCLTCSPFGLHNTCDLSAMPIEQRCCPKCEKTKPISEFYNRRNQIGKSVYCKPCTKDQTILRQQKFKLQCLTYKGGCCEKCSYSSCIAALEFHHNDSKQKDFNISQARLLTFNDSVKHELDKCTLLCANCHRELHTSLNLSQQHNSLNSIGVPNHAR